MWRRPSDAKSASPEPESYVPPAPIAPRAAEPAAPVARDVEATRITHAISIRGEISGGQNLFIDGELQGSIHLPESRVTVGVNGRLKADIEAEEIVVEGQVNGSLTAGTRVVIRRTGRVYGSIITERLAIEEGAVFNGKVEMVGSGEAAARRPSVVPQPAYRTATP